jgi:Putative zinc-finger
MVMSCEQVWREVSNYLDGDITPELRSAVEEHLRGCKHCTAVMDGTRNVIQLYSDDRMLEVPLGFDQRLRRRIAQSMPPRRGTLLGWTLAAAAAMLLIGALSIGNSVASKNITPRSALARPAAPSIPSDMMVVVYGDGKTFHTSQCTFIHDRSKARTMTASEALREGFTPCVRCLRKYLGQTAFYSETQIQEAAALQSDWTFPGSIANRWFENEDFDEGVDTE